MIDRVGPLLAVTMLMATLAAPAECLAQVPDPPREWPLSASVLLVEAVAFGSGFMARSESGARVVGGIHGASGLTALSIAFLDARSAPPAFMIPYGIGLLSLSWYNFTAATGPPRRERFWTNVIGVNAVVLLSGLSAVVLDGPDHGSARVRLRAGPGVLLATISF